MDGGANGRQVDVVIVGAGMSGLAAADALKQINIMRVAGERQLSFVVLEGSERAGGRTHTVEPGQGFLDVGGQYLGPSQSYAQLMVERFGLRTFPTWLPVDKPSIYQSDLGRLTFFHKDYPLTDDVLAAIEKLEFMVAMTKCNIGEPWKTPAAKLLDNQSVAQWADREFKTVFGKELMSLAIRCAFSVEPEDISMLYLLYYAATCGSFRAFENVNGGGDAIRLARGMKSLSDALLGAIGEENVRYKSKVGRIEQNDDEVRVFVQNDSQPWVARRAIVALSPVVSAEKIDYSPTLPDERIALSKGAPMAQTIKGFLRYERAWWRDDFTGYVLSAKGPASWIMDNTWRDPDSGEFKYPALMTFIAGKFAREWATRTAEERRAALEAQLKTLFAWRGNAIPTAIEYYEQDWASDPWAGGGPAGCFTTNILTQYGPHLRRPYKLIHWAGSETATEWTGGYVNGALQAGIRAAGEVADLLLTPALADVAAVPARDNSSTKTE